MQAQEEHSSNNREYWKVKLTNVINCATLVCDLPFHWLSVSQELELENLALQISLPHWFPMIVNWEMKDRRKGPTCRGPWISQLFQWVCSPLWTPPLSLQPSFSAFVCGPLHSVQMLLVYFPVPKNKQSQFEFYSGGCVTTLGYSFAGFGNTVSVGVTVSTKDTFNLGNSLAVILAKSFGTVLVGCINITPLTRPWHFK